jgi:hypothetical protein
MPARDIFHNSVKTALQKDGWKITDDPLFIRCIDVELYIDLSATLITAEKTGQQIAVQVKSFTRSSALSEFHTALGQFLNYRVALECQDPDRILYLAIPTDAFDTFFQLEFTQIVIQRYQLKLIVCDMKQEVIVVWQN